MCIVDGSIANQIRGVIVSRKLIQQQGPNVTGVAFILIHTFADDGLMYFLETATE